MRRRRLNSWVASASLSIDTGTLVETKLGTSLQVIGAVIVVTGTSMTVKLTNGNQPLNRLTLESSTNGVDYTEEASTWSDYISLAGILTATSGELVTLGAGELGTMSMNTTGKSHIRLKGSVTQATQTTGISGIWTQS